MSDMIGAGAATIRHGEVRYQASVVRLLQATQKDSKDGIPLTVVTEADAAKADNKLGRLVDMKT